MARYNDFALHVLQDNSVTLALLQAHLPYALSKYLQTTTVELLHHDTRTVPSSLPYPREGDYLLEINTNGPLKTFLLSLELQRTTDATMGLRLAQYQAGYLLNAYEKNPTAPLLPLLSLVLYHGSGTFGALTQAYGDVSPALRPYLIGLESGVMLVNLSACSDAWFEKQGAYTAVGLLLKHSDRCDDTLLKQLFPHLMENRLRTRQACLLFFLDRTKMIEAQCLQVIRSYIGDTEMQTLGEKLREKERQIIAQNLLAIGRLTLQEIACCTELPFETIEQLQTQQHTQSATATEPGNTFSVAAAPVGA